MERAVEWFERYMPPGRVRASRPGRDPASCRGIEVSLRACHVRRPRPDTLFIGVSRTCSADRLYGRAYLREPVIGADFLAARLHWHVDGPLITKSFDVFLERPFRGSKRRGGEDSCGGFLRLSACCAWRFQPGFRSPAAPAIRRELLQWLGLRVEGHRCGFH